LSGSERIERLRYLSKEGNEVYLIAGKFRKELYQTNQNLHLVSIPLKYLPIISPILYGLVLFFFLPIYLVGIRPDFLITDDTTTPFLVWKPILSRLLGFKVVMDIRGTPVGKSARSRIFFTISVYLAKAMFDGMTIVTPMMREEICQAYRINPEWVGVLPNGISDGFLAPEQLSGDRIELRERLGLSERFVVMYHGSLNREIGGGLIESIEAIGLAKRNHPSIVLFLLGSASARFLSKLNEAIEKNDVAGNVLLHRSVDFHSVPKYIAMSDVGLVPLMNIPLWRYQQPIKLLEYMAMKKSVIVSESPAHRSVIGSSKNAIYVPQVNSAELSRAIEYAYDNRNMLEEWGKVGQEIIQKKYVWKKVNECLTSYLTKIRKDTNRVRSAD
jgi:glycosyltransferase involved in cell wall biosynthesis